MREIAYKMKLREHIIVLKTPRRVKYLWILSEID